MSDKISEKQALILGALLHDVGKFYQRTFDKKTESHTYLGREFFIENLREKLFKILNQDVDIIEIAIGNHHEHTEFITHSDWLSAGMDRIPLEEEEKGDPSFERLASIMEKISLNGETDKKEYTYFHDLKKLSMEHIFPAKFPRENLSKKYKELWDDFIKELKFLPSSNIDIFIESLFFLLMKYTWCVPSAVYKDEPDISLFDHLKTTAAIAGCLYDYHQENPNETLNIETPAFQLVAGDISGIQNYIFDILSQQGRVAKRLRARSLYIQLISEIAAHKIVHKFNLPLCNIISSAGGNFYILLPNLKDTEEELKKLQKEFDEWTYKNFKAEIYLTIGNISTSGKELSEYNKLLDKLKNNQQIKKYQPYYSILTTDGKWNNNFVLDEVIKGDEDVCSSCHKHPIKQDEMCEWCLTDEKIGAELPKANFIVFFKDKQQGYPILDYSFDFNKKEHFAYLVLALNDTSQVGTGFKYLSNHIPTKNDIDCTNAEHQHEANQPVFFDCIADNSKGDSLIGYVKADVDNMGEILRNGFQKTKPSISRFVSLSRMLETFFAGYLQKRLETDFRDIYTVFSGGDDFFIIGPWNRTIDFVRMMRNEFTRFTGKNLDFTFSTGIILAKPHEPISFCAELVEDELKKSKKYPDKDRITLFNQTVKWDELDKVLSETSRVINWLENEPPVISRGFVYNLRQYGEMSQEFDKTNDIKYIKFVPLLIYDINRNLTKEEQKEARDWAIKLSPLVQKPEEENCLPFLRIIMDYVLTYTR